MLKLYRNHQGKTILFFVCLAFLFGIVTPNMFIHLKFISDTFINLLKLCALPIVLTSLIVNLGNLSNLHELKQVARNTVIFIILTEIIAVTIGLIVFNLINITKNINATNLLDGAKYTQSTRQLIINYI